MEKNLYEEQAVDILRHNLFMVDQFQDEEKAAFEEDLIRMHRRCLEEEEALKLMQLENDLLRLEV